MRERGSETKNIKCRGVSVTPYAGFNAKGLRNLVKTRGIVDSNITRDFKEKSGWLIPKAENKKSLSFPVE